jgi:hypothetical protein
VIGEGDYIIECSEVEVISLRVKSTPKACVFTAKVRVAGLGSNEIADLIDWLGNEQKFTIERRQGVLPFRSRKSPGEVGEVVSGVHENREYAGVIVNRTASDAGDVIEVDDCGRLFLVPAATISGSFQVTNREAPLAEFVKRAKKAKVTPSWLALVPALGRAYLSGGASQEWKLTDEIVAAALESARASA